MKRVSRDVCEPMKGSRQQLGCWTQHPASDLGRITEAGTTGLIDPTFGKASLFFCTGAAYSKGAYGPQEVRSAISPQMEKVRGSTCRCALSYSSSKVFEQFEDHLLAIEDVYAAYDTHRRRIQELRFNLLCYTNDCCNYVQSCIRRHSADRAPNAND